MSINEKGWIKFNGTLPSCGRYEVKINNKVLKGVAVNLINTYEGDNPNKKLHGFCISKLTIMESDRRESSGWISKSDYIFLRNVTHYRESSHDKEIRYIDGHFYRYIEMSHSLENKLFNNSNW